MLRRDAEFAGFFHVAVGHARSIERGGGAALAVEQNQATGGMHAMREFANAGVGDGLRERQRPGLLTMRKQDALVMQKIGGHFGHDNFHDAFAVAGAGNSAGFRVGIAAATDQR